MIRTDDLQNGYKIMQDEDGFCFGTDAVLLSDFAKIKKGETVMDICCGNGIIPILLNAKYSPGHITGIEIQSVVADLAKKNMELNGFDNVNIVCDDLKNAHNHIEKPVDVITCNPPYTAAGSGMQNTTDTKIIARHEVKCNLDDIMECVGRNLKFGGRFYMVHKPERTGEIIAKAAEKKLALKFLQYTYSGTEREASLALFGFMKGAGVGAKILPPIFDERTIL